MRRNTPHGLKCDLLSPDVLRMKPGDVEARAVCTFPLLNYESSASARGRRLSFPLRLLIRVVFVCLSQCSRTHF